jgi:superfamily I DNA/RNA helicase
MEATSKVFKPSKYQQAVYDFLSNGKGNAVIDAVAGSGKSSTIVQALKLISMQFSVLFLAFNKSIVDELKIKIGEQKNVEIRTLHSLGASAVMKSFKCTIDNNKYRSYINQTLNTQGIDPDDVTEYKSKIFKLVDLARVSLCKSVSDLEAIAEKHNVFCFDDECNKAMEYVAWGVSDNGMGTIDFTDMIYVPNVKKIRMPVFDYVFIDECQDLNTAQREMFLKCLSQPNGRFISVGDPRQAIYGFSGADVESFEVLKNLPNTITLPLSVCYRCDEDIINIAKEIVPQIEARDKAPKGKVDHEAKVEMIQDNDMVLCRVTAPLVDLCMKYISKGVKAYVKGKDIGANLINMITKTKRRNIEDVIEKLEDELDKIVRKVVRKTHCSESEARTTDAFTSYKDKINAIIILSEGLRTSNEVISRIETIFKDDQKIGICLSTIHKAKGLEADNVYIICKDKFYLKQCMKVEWMAEQEHNLVYVAYTRAKHYLGFVVDFKCD